MEQAAARPALVGAAGAAALGYLALVHPGGTGGLPTLPCPFHAATGLWCPGCGMTRALHSVVSGHPIAAFGHNLFWPVLVVVIGWAVAGWAWPKLPRLNRVPGMAWAGLVGAALVYGILRDVPAFAALSP